MDARERERERETGARGRERPRPAHTHAQGGTPMNRIADCIARYGERIDAHGDTVDHLHKELAITMAEFLTFQSVQTRAHVEGKITTEEAATIYAALGGETYHGDWPEGTPLAAKVTVTQVMEELLAMQIRAKKGVRP